MKLKMSAFYSQANTKRSTDHRRRNFNVCFVRRCSVFNEIRLLNLVFELKFLDVFMGREDPIELDIWSILLLFFFFGLFLFF